MRATDEVLVEHYICQGGSWGSHEAWLDYEIQNRSYHLSCRTKQRLQIWRHREGAGDRKDAVSEGYSGVREHDKPIRW